MLPRRPAGFLVAGNVVFDILVRPVSELTWNSSTFVESIGQQLGGNGSNTSFALARLGAPARLVAWVGNDLFGNLAVDKLREAGVDLSVLRRGDSLTATSVALVNPSGARAFLQQPGISHVAFREPLEFTPELVGQATHFHLGNPFSLPLMRRQAAATLGRARQCGLTTSLDTAWDAMGEWTAVIDPCLPYIDLLFVNEDESRRLSREEDPERAAAFFQSRGVG
ncbi:MAG: carbohydrate kinase family protein, partial [Acidobacteria bacterium]|nr:carbohydrate kinase family protein [Acidobacteriota bacterium]